MRSPGGWPEVPCAECGTRVAGLGWGELCPECRRARARRARRLASRAALGATALMGLYVALRVPAEPLARLYAVIAVIVTYLIVYRIVIRIAMELLK